METILRAGLGNAVAATLLAVLVAVLGGPFRRSPALRHVLWLLVLLKLVTPPMGWVPVAWPVVPVAVEPSRDPAPAIDVGGDGEAPGYEAVEIVEAIVPDAVPAPRPVPASWTWRHGVAGVWLAGSSLTFAVAFARVRRFRRVLRLARPVPDEASGQVEALARRLGLARVPRLWCVPGAFSPMLWSLGGPPRLIVPEALWECLDGVQRATLLAHELAHLRRRDHWVRGLELLVNGLYWWLPTAWLARRALREAEEQCCDAWVVWALPDASRTYAETLLQTVDFLSGAGPAVPVAASGLGHLHHLKRRLTMIMQGTTPRTLGRAGALLVLGLSAALLPLSPTWAQRADPERTDQPVVVADQSEIDRAVAVRKQAEDRFEWSNRMLEKGYVSKGQNRADRAILGQYDLALDQAQAKKGPDRDVKEKTTDGDTDRPEEVAKLLDQLKALGSSEDLGPDEVARKEKIERVVQKLQEALKQRIDAKKSKTEKSGKEGPSGDQKGETEKTRAEMEKARAEIQALAAKVQEKHREFQEAELALQRAIGRLSRIAEPRFRAGVGREAVVGSRDGRVFEYRVVRPSLGSGAGIPVPPRPPGEPDRPSPRVRVSPSPNPDERIDALEKRLDQLLDTLKPIVLEQKDRALAVEKRVDQLLDEVKRLKQEKEEGTSPKPKKEKAEKEILPPPAPLDGLLSR